MSVDQRTESEKKRKRVVAGVIRANEDIVRRCEEFLKKEGLSASRRKEIENAQAKAAAAALAAEKKYAASEKEYIASQLKEQKAQNRKKILPFGNG